MPLNVFKIVMKRFIPLWVTGILCFGLGYIVAQFSSEKEIVFSNAIVERSQQNHDAISETDLQHLLNQHSNQGASPTSQNKISQVSKMNAMIAEASPEEVEYYLNQAFPKADLSLIKDKKKFAQRATEEFAQTKNDEQNDLTGQVIVAIQEQFNGSAQVLQNIHKSQYLFAHLDTFNKIENAHQVFIRWINRDTGEVLFFSPQNITANKAQNWVSFVPEQGWKVGTYDVRYYQMQDDLKPIAQTSYVIESLAE